MRRQWSRWLVVVLGLASLSPSVASSPARKDPGGPVPRLVLWAWERPTDLRDLGPRTGVAFLAQTITLADDTFTVEPRRNPLRVSPRTPLVAVTRIETLPGRTAELSRRNLETVAELVSASRTWPQVVGLQIDYDAVVSERRLYRALLMEVRARIGSSVPLAITALASWCAEDRWLDGLPVDEAIPMLFRMGPANEPYASIGLSTRAADPVCVKSLGIALDEPLPVRAGNRRVYVFNSSPWTSESVRQARGVGQ